ncbi:MAG: CinA family nicotinamide mononucleotide deamidase-related protein [Planctomycetota bacterium]|nr:CinA family nicotinamide mononucleotide deamidase-related protein [Planctomycetota bacterium]
MSTVPMGSMGPTGPTGHAPAALVAVGDELLAGAHPDLNSPEVARHLADLGLTVDRVAVIGDDEEALAALVEELAARYAIVVVTGGLGPTLDDVTRHAIARGLGRELVESDEALAQIGVWFDRRGVTMSDTNRRQALFPVGAEMLPNTVGTAPGFRLELDGCTLFALPGPPYEMRTMLEAQVLPWIAERREIGPEPEARFRLFGLSESVFAERAGEWMERDANPRMGCSAKEGVLTVVLRARGDSGARLLEERVSAFRERFGERVFTEEDAALEEVVGRRLIDAGITVSTAESCTGGLVAALLTRVPGVSAVLGEGFVTYSNEAKVARLGVAPELLELHGAVSGEVAEAMARGAAAATGARAAVSTTGIAGPSGGTEEKPVGLVWFGFSVDGKVDSVSRRIPPGNRKRVLAMAARWALYLLLRRLPAD